ncbi:MAG: helix-turn-helix domain-containing protein [Alphaproteobacteria bacterium]
MDSLITAAAQALAKGDPFGALNRVALRDDAPALALRGVAMAQLGDYASAKRLLRRAARAFGPKEALARARCVVAEAEIALASRELTWPAKALEAARAALDAHGDAANAAYARMLEARRLLLIGKLDAAERSLAALDPAPFPPALRAGLGLMLAGLAMRRVRAQAAGQALAAAARAAKQAGIPALSAEIASATRLLQAPAARLIGRGGEKTLRLAEVEALFASPALIVDGCRHAVRESGQTVSLAGRPVLFALARALAEAWPEDVTREALVKRAFNAKDADDSHRARLRVEIGRLRTALRAHADIVATRQGFVLAPRRARRVALLARPVDDAHGEVLALLADGESWSSAALALALNASQRTLQRALDDLAARGMAQAVGRGRARRWMMPPLPGTGPGVASAFTTPLLLPAMLPGR